MKMVVDVETKLAQLEQAIFNTYSQNSSSSFMCGNGALPLLYHKLYSIYNKDIYLEKADIIIDALLDEINSGLTSTSYCNGLAGLASMLNYLAECNIIDEGVEDLLQQCDIILYQVFVENVNQKNLDYLHGALGVAFYFVHRQSTNSNITTTLIQVGEEILKNCISNLNSVDNKYINLGMAHGQMSVLMFLVNYINIAPHPKKIANAIRAIVEQVLSYRTINPNSLAQFPSIVSLQTEDFEESYNTPNGWCYGDAMISLCILAASKVLQDEHLQKKAISIALLSTKRDTPARAVIIDAAMCHGSAGLAHIYKKWYQITGNPEFKVSYEYWVNQTLLMGDRQGGLGGFQKYTGPDSYSNALGLLDGVCGIGLVLADFVEDSLSNNSENNNSDWDRFFALSTS
jgi:hypothetical protein